MQLTNQQILTLSEAITHLDGQHLMQIVEGKAVHVFRSYHLSAPGRWLLARAQGALQAAIADFNRAKDALINHHSGGTGELKLNSPNLQAFSGEFAKLKAQPVELDIPKIAIEHLCMEENAAKGNGIPIGVLGALMPVITEPAATPALKARA